MPPISQERLNWIEARLFILARTIQVLRRDGLRTATRYFTDNPQEAWDVYKQTLQDLNRERLALMMERVAIEEYTREEMGGMPNGS